MTKFGKGEFAILAHQGTLEACKNIERFLETKEKSLEVWAALALQECRMFLESSLSDRIGGILMTGLGGKITSFDTSSLFVQEIMPPLQVLRRKLLSDVSHTFAANLTQELKRFKNPA